MHGAVSTVSSLATDLATVAESTDCVTSRKLLIRLGHLTSCPRLTGQNRCGTLLQSIYVLVTMLIRYTNISYVKRNKYLMNYYNHHVTWCHRALS